MIISMTKKLILRSPLKSILTIIFSISIIIFIGLYINNIKTLETSLRKLSQTIPVTGEICDISGSKTTGLEIDERKGNQIIFSQYVVQAKYTIQVVANNINNQNNISTTLMGCNSIDALPLLYDDNINFMSGNDSSFLTDDKNNCIVEADFAKQNNIVLGQEITFLLSIYKYDSGVYLTDNIDNIKMNVIGIYDYNSATNTSIIVPVKSLARLVKESGNEVFYDSLKFELKDPGKLNEFKQDVKKHIDAIANKYIIRGVTSDQAIMFLPAEALFAELNAYHPDIIDYAYRKRVWIASPTTLMSTLTTIELVMKNIEKDKYTSIIHEELNKLSIDFGRYKERWDKLSRSIEAVSRDANDIHITTDKISKRFDAINNVDAKSLQSGENSD